MMITLALIALIGLAGAPPAAAYLWFLRRRRSFVPLPFLAALGAGLLAPVLAAAAQYAVPPAAEGNLPALLFNIFARIALVEEGSKFLVLYAVATLKSRSTAAPTSAWAASAGLVAGLGFALVETASLATSGPGAAVIRALTAAPLHGACGARVGSAVFARRRSPLRSLLRFLSAVAIHGMYNLLLVLPGVSFFLPVALAFVALASSVAVIGSSPPDAPV
jgi:RsiW-degrading membrane proteinase PrsW (M82 family)